MKEVLILIEHDGACAKRGSLSAISAARQLNTGYALLVIGHGVTGVAESLRPFGAAAVLVADDPALAQPLADRYAAVVVQAAQALASNHVLAASSAFTKDILPRAAAGLDSPMATDVTNIHNENSVVKYQRPIHAGSLIATVTLDGECHVLTLRQSAFQPALPNGALSPVERISIDASTLPNGTEFISRELRKSARPDLSEARVVISGGRPLKDQETFERLIGGLADALGGAVGATRAAVDAGMAANECQIGQTGKVVAPELYIGVGVSGSIQHLAGIKDSRVIVAINRDPDAPIFQNATYGLVGDLFEVLPRLIDSVRRS